MTVAGQGFCLREQRAQLLSRELPVDGGYELDANGSAPPKGRPLHPSLAQPGALQACGYRGFLRLVREKVKIATLWGRRSEDEHSSARCVVCGMCHLREQRLVIEFVHGLANRLPLASKSITAV